MALSAWLISRFNSNAFYFTTLSTRTRVRYTLFLSIWTMILSALYLAMGLGARIGGAFGSWASHLFSCVQAYLFQFVAEVCRQAWCRLDYVA